MPEFNLMGATPITTVNGPGERYMIHLQGCNLGCKNCFNPESWSFKIKNLVCVENLARDILQAKPDGLTISGGEPFLQAPSLHHFIKYLYKDGKPFPKGIIIYSGFTEEELQNIPEYHEIINLVDVIISGRYDETLRVYETMLSSSNQKYIWGKQNNILEEELNNQDFEVIIEEDGIKLTGFPDLSKQSKSFLKSVGVEIKGN